MASPELSILTDSTCDLPEAKGITVIPAIVTINGAQYLDGREITPAEVLKLMEDPKLKATTAAPGPEFIRGVMEHMDGEMLAITIPEKQSGFFQAFSLASREVDPTGKRASVFDSGMTSLALGHMVEVAAKLRDAGFAKDRIINKLTDLRKRAKIRIAFDVLEYARRSGRVSNLTAFMGSLIKIKPIIGMESGSFIQIETPRTRGKQLGDLVEMIKGMAPLEWIGVVYAGVKDEAEEVAHRLQDLVETKIVITHIGTALSIHAGPGTIGVCAFSAG